MHRLVYFLMSVLFLQPVLFSEYTDKELTEIIHDEDRLDNIFADLEDNSYDDLRSAIIEKIVKINEEMQQIGGTVIEDLDYEDAEYLSE